MPTTPQHTLLQQFGRFLVTGALTFAVSFWLSSSALLSPAVSHQDKLALRLLIRGLTTQSFVAWLGDLHTGYLPFFLGQRPLVLAYLAAAPLAWTTAFLYDIKIMRKENIV